MIKSATLGKTIFLIWEYLTDEQVVRLQKALKNILSTYQQSTKEYNTNPAVPIRLYQKSHYLVVMYKNGNLLVSANKITKNDKPRYNYKPIRNGDFLYASISMLEKCQPIIKRFVKTSMLCPKSQWIVLPFVKATEQYLLSPNINPVDFVKSLQSGNLPDMYKNFLENVGISLKEHPQDLLKEEYNRE